MLTPRQTALPAAFFIVALWLTVVLINGCGDGNDNGNGSGTRTGDGSSTSGDTSADDTKTGETDGGTSVVPNGYIPQEKPLFDGWTQPAAALVLTGQQRGYIEPCGCTEGQSGGISRRATLIAELKEKSWPVAALDLGGTVHRNRRQSQLKFETMLAAMKDMEYRALGLGPQELLFGPEYLLSQNVADEEHPASNVAFLSANVVIFDTPDLGTPLHSRLITVGGQKIGVTAILGKSKTEQIFPGGPPQDISLTDAAKSLEPIVADFEQQQTTLNVLLAYADIEQSKELAKQFPQFQIVVSGGGPEDPDKKPMQVGKTMLLTVGQKGKYVGVVGFYPNDEKTPLRYQLVELKKDRFKDNLKMVDHMKYYQDRLKEERLSAVELPIKHPSGAEFVGAAACGECHTKAYDIWKKTPHARAFESLKHPREGEPDYGITRIYDAECLACHVTGWHPQEVLRYETGFVNEEFAASEADKQRSKLLQGQQCESCHGPGSRHIELIDDGKTEEAAASVRVTLQEAEDKTCHQCHDLDNSPHFEFKKYWTRVKHYGTD